MHSFDDIFNIAAQRQGGEEALKAKLTLPVTADDLAAIPDDRWLSAMSKRIFQAGFNWGVIETKWPGFEEAFEGFVPSRVAMYHGDDLDRLMADTRIVRNGPKVQAVLDNAVYLQSLANEYGSAAKFFANWPEDDLIGLLENMNKNGSRLGPGTAQRFLRLMGKDCFVLSPDVTARLIAEGVIDKPATSKSALAAVQQAFWEWRKQSSRSFSEISQVLAMSIDANT